MKKITDRPSSKWNLLRLCVLICTTFVSTLSFGQAGNAPMQDLPQFPGFFAIDGFLQRQGAQGDWLQAAGGSANNYVFTNAGVPVPGLIAFHLVDLFNDQDNDDIFDGGNKLFHDPNTWGWRSQKPPAKDDMNNSLVFVALNPTPGPNFNHIWLAINGDRMSTNGTSYLDFEFYQAAITKTGGPTTGGFLSLGTDGGRTVGDISITLEYTAGGSLATVKYLRWQPGAEAGSFDYFDITPTPGLAFAAANAGDINVPYGAFGLTTYEELQFIEGAIDLTAIIGGTGPFSECAGLPFETLFIKSKSSAEKTADLKDFFAPLQINICFDVTAPVISCPNTLNLGCNPSIPTPSGATASDNCDGAIVPVASDAPAQSSGCNRTIVRTWRAEDDCGNVSTCAQLINFTVDNTGPSLSSGGTTTTLGCNPSAGDINGALGTASASDACSTPTISQSDGSVSSNSCSRSQTRTWVARDACGNTTSTARTVTWTADVTAPSVSANGTTTTLGCNPSAGDINLALGSASATDACGPTTVTQSDGPVGSTSCGRSQTRTFTARDGCGNTATTSRTVTWTADTTPPGFTGSYTTQNLGCNPVASDIAVALNGATATDACGPVTITQSDGSVQTTSCGQSQTRTFTARDGCGNTATISRTVNWGADATPPVFTGSYTTVALGCNPAASDIGAALNGATATDGCGPTTISQSDGPVGSTSCGRSQTRTFVARDACGNTSSVSRTVTWTADVTPPGFTGSYSNVPLGCNPAASDIAAALDGATATDACGPTTITQGDGPVNSDGCLRIQTRTFTARDGCGNTATISRSVSWTADVTPPGITTGGCSLTLGCNPAASDIACSLGTASATDACGPTTLTIVDGSITSDGCTRRQTRTFIGRDGCGNTATTSRTVSWTADVTPPGFTGSYTTVALGCNPAASDINTALDGATATDGCGPVTISQSDGSVSSDGCSRSQTRTFVARDGCGNTASVSRTVTWTADTTPPVITTGGTGPALGCNPAASDINNALGTATASDACGARTLSSVDGSVSSTGCGRSQTRTWTARDACGNTSTASRTATWTADVTPPVLINCPSSVDIDCNVAVPTATAPTATDACGTPTVTQTGSTDNAADCSTGFSRVVTRTWTARDACGNTSTCSQTIRVRCCPSLFCTYTQGAYGTEGGTMCDGENGDWTTEQFINNSLANWGGSFTVGKPGHSVLVNSAACVLSELPGTGPATELPAADYNLCALPASLQNAQGRIKNILLAQTITLGLNLGIENTQLGSFVLQAGELATQDPVDGCGDDTPETRVCHYNVLAPFNLISVENQYTFRTFTQEVIDAIPGANTVANLYELANRALANVDGVVGSEGGASLGAIADAVGNLNEVFDKCKIFIGWNVAPCPPIDPTPGDGRVAPTSAPVLSVTAYPNPYQENFSLKVNSPVTGEASIGFYTIDGVKIGEMKRDVVANKDQWVPFNVPAVYRTRIVYTVSVGTHNAKGVVLSPNEP